MILSYWIRLLSLCFALFFLAHAVVGLMVWRTEKLAIRFAERMRPRAAARVLLLVRILPAAFAALVVLGLCAPSYLGFESNTLPERVGPVCLAAALLGIVLALSAFDRGFSAAVSSLGFARVCRRSGQMIRLHGKPSHLLVIPGPRPFLAQCGIFRSRIVISLPLLREFSPAELAAALSHERGHWISRDNLKRLLLAFLPDVLPFLAILRPLEQGWAKFSERAADDYVCAAGEDQATSLASALVRLARIGNVADLHAWAPLATSPLGGTDDLSGRVHRLLASGPANFDCRPGRIGAVLKIAAVIAVSWVAVLAWPATLSPMHEFLERLLH
jgi:Zn-dependent protease with chaperone function